MWQNFYPVQYFTQIVSMLAMFEQLSNMFEIFMTSYFQYLCDILYALHIHFLNASYHLTRWQKQVCPFVSIIWVEHSKVLWYWGCDSCVWIVWQDLLGSFLVLFSSFELHIVWLNHLSTSILFDWTVPVAVHWLYRIWLNVLPSHILFAGPFT